MKTKVLLVGLLIGLVSGCVAPAQTSLITGAITAPDGRAMVTGISFETKSTPLVQGGKVQPHYKLTITNAADGRFTNALWAGDYLVTIRGVGGWKDSQFFIAVPATNGLLEMSGLITTSLTLTNKAPPQYFLPQIMIAKGDLLGFDGTNFVRIAAGVNGQYLKVDSTAVAGVRFVTASAGGGGAGYLYELGDVSIGEFAANGDILVYDRDNNLWYTWTPRWATAADYLDRAGTNYLTGPMRFATNNSATGLEFPLKNMLTCDARYVLGDAYFHTGEGVPKIFDGAGYRSFVLVGTNSNVGIGTNVAREKLTVEGKVKALGFLTASGSEGISYTDSLGGRWENGIYIGNATNGAVGTYGGTATNLVQQFDVAGFPLYYMGIFQNTFWGLGTNQSGNHPDVAYVPSYNPGSGALKPVLAVWADLKYLKPGVTTGKLLTLDGTGVLTNTAMAEADVATKSDVGAATNAANAYADGVAAAASNSAIANIQSSNYASGTFIAKTAGMGTNITLVSPAGTYPQFYQSSFFFGNFPWGLGTNLSAYPDIAYVPAKNDTPPVLMLRGLLNMQSAYVGTGKLLTTAGGYLTNAAIGEADVATVTMVNEASNVLAGMIGAGSGVSNAVGTVKSNGVVIVTDARAIDVFGASEVSSNSGGVAIIRIPTSSSGGSSNYPAMIANQVIATNNVITAGTATNFQLSAVWREQSLEVTNAGVGMLYFDHLTNHWPNVTWVNVRLYQATTNSLPLYWDATWRWSGGYAPLYLSSNKVATLALRSMVTATTTNVEAWYTAEP